MTQSSLLGYFTPIQPRPVKGLAEQKEQSGCFTGSAKNEAQNILNELGRNQDASPSGSSVLATIPPSNPGGGNIDFVALEDQPQAAIVKVLSPHLSRLKSITSTLLPVRYPDKFFIECLEDEVVADLSRVLLWNSQPVGWIRCRLEDNENGRNQIYVQAIGILAPYRGFGLATGLIAQVTNSVTLQKYNPTSIYCHVWESNEDAIEWYEKRGFKRVILVEQYYRRLKPAGAWIMRKELA